MELILIRHGQTEWNATGRWQGQADPPLNEMGRAQASRTALELRDQKIEALISSDLLRAQQTAQIIGAALNMDVQLEPRLREVHLGDWQGLYSEDIRARWPERMQQWIETPLATTPPNGESIAQLAERVLAAVNDLARRYAQQRVGIVAHELPIAIIVTQSQGIPLEQLRAYIPPNAAWQTTHWNRARA
jgi:broad specificity phosphatase PhoE